MDNKATALKWYKQAVHDIDLAEKNIQIKGYDVSAFLSQQAVEKLLKAIILLKGKKNPRTHYIDELAKILELPEDVVQDVLDLTGDYMFSRYPDIGDKVPYEEYDEEIALEKVTKAKGIFLKLKDFVKPIDDMLERENENEGE
jgi:HEPN domain-containing protein